MKSKEKSILLLKIVRSHYLGSDRTDQRWPNSNPWIYLATASIVPPDTIIIHLFIWPLQGDCKSKHIMLKKLNATFWQFDIHMSMHRKYNSKLQPTRCNVSYFVYFYRHCTCFRRFLRPSSGAHNCTYSFRYCQPILLLAAIMDEMERGHLIHDSSQQQYWLTIPEAVCTVMCAWWWMEELPETCTVSVEINKIRNVAFCWL